MRSYLLDTDASPSKSNTVLFRISTDLRVLQAPPLSHAPQYKTHLHTHLTMSNDGECLRQCDDRWLALDTARWSLLDNLTAAAETKLTEAQESIVESEIMVGIHCALEGLSEQDPWEATENCVQAIAGCRKLSATTNVRSSAWLVDIEKTLVGTILDIATLCSELNLGADGICERLPSRPYSPDHARDLVGYCRATRELLGQSK